MNIIKKCKVKLEKRIMFKTYTEIINTEAFKAYLRLYNNFKNQ